MQLQIISITTPKSTKAANAIQVTPNVLNDSHQYNRVYTSQMTVIKTYWQDIKLIKRNLPTSPTPAVLAECCFTSTETVGLLALTYIYIYTLTYIYIDIDIYIYMLIRDGSPGRPPQLSHSSWGAGYPR